MQSGSGKSTIHVHVNKGFDSHWVKLLTMASLEPRGLSQVVRDRLSTLVFGVGYRAGILDSFIKTQQPCRGAGKTGRDESDVGGSKCAAQ